MFTLFPDTGVQKMQENDVQEDGALALISLDGKMAVEITAASEHLSGVFCVAMHMNNDPVDHFCVLRVSAGYAKKRHLQRMQKKIKKKIDTRGTH